ncbi:histidine phosphatase family protein [Lactobacillus helveticus]|nr:histidine phosphatase family protein [Lactobacillus helveticus]MBW8037314.1 histidine phosphatase family protein [Lactobacillus helveticus]
MSKLYLMRHGETYFNIWHKMQGWCDSPLTPNGINQAKAAREYFLNNHIKFDKAYCSTSERASDTLEIVTDKQMAYQRLKGLKEEYFGSFEGQDERLNPQVPYNAFFVQYGGEDQKDVQKRVFDTISSFMAKAQSNEKVLAVSHAGACFNFLIAIRVDPQQFLKKRSGNCSILVIDYKDEKFKLEDLINPN